MSHYPGETADLLLGNGETPTGQSPGSVEGLGTMVGSPTATSEMAEKAFAGFEPAADRRVHIPEACAVGGADRNHPVWESCLVQFCGQADRQWRDPRHRYRHRSASFASTRLLRKGDEPWQRPLRRRQNQRPGSIQSGTRPRSLAACCRRARYEARWCGGGCY